VPKGFEEDYHNEPMRVKKLATSTKFLRRSSMEPRTPTSPRSPQPAATTGQLRRGSVPEQGAVKLATSPREEATPTDEQQPSEDQQLEAASARGWWSRMDSATYNEQVVEGDPAEWRQGSYVPQHLKGVSEDAVVGAEYTPH